MSLKFKTRVWKGIQVKDFEFPNDQYYPVHTHKKQIGLHHLASGPGMGYLDWWLSTTSKIATCCIVHREGNIDTLFSSKFYAKSLGIKVVVFDQHKVDRIYRTRANGTRYVANNEILDEGLIGLEINSWGQLELKNGKYYSWAGTKVDSDNVHYYEKAYRGFHYYEKYTAAQIESTRLLLIYWRDSYGIDIEYKGDRMFDVCKEALQGENGVWSHTSYRSDKFDLHPQPELIAMLKTLKN